MKNKVFNTGSCGLLAVGMAFLVSFGFFLLAYPYHLMKREQFNLFVYDWDYLIQRFDGTGWLSRFVASFLEQFFCVRTLGPFVVAMLLTATGIVTFRICRKFFGVRLSYVIAALVFLWSFLRECGDTYLTRYTIATLAFMSIILLALQFRRNRDKALASALLLSLGAWVLGPPCNSDYGKLWGLPNMDSERVFGQDVELVRENWDRVLKLSEKDLYMTESSVCYNLALSMKGQLGNRLLEHSQGDPMSFLLFVSGDYALYANCLAGEQWYQLGDMTIAEQSAITALQASPEHTGARFVERLARVNVITGQKAAAQKYLNLLSRTVFYGRWADRMLDGNPDEEDRIWLDRARSKMAVTDTIYAGYNPRAVLHLLLEADPSNTPAREYLLCYDLLRYDLEQFMEDYEPFRLDAHIYKEAVVLWFGRDGYIPLEIVEEYDLNAKLKQKMDNFNRYPNRYKDTYWYYYFKAMK